jgi:hypothetical protein
LVDGPATDSIFISNPLQTMRDSRSESLSDLQVAQLERRRIGLSLTRPMLLERFAQALKEAGCVHTAAAAKMRLDRIFNPRMRRPVSESTKAALATALEWNLRQLETALAPRPGQPHNGSDIMPDTASRSAMRHLARDLMMTARTLQASARKLESLAAKNRNRVRKQPRPNNQ